MCSFAQFKSFSPVYVRNLRNVKVKAHILYLRQTKTYLLRRIQALTRRFWNRVSRLNQAQPFPSAHRPLSSLPAHWIIVALTVLHRKLTHWIILLTITSADVQALSLARVIRETSLATWVKYLSWNLRGLWFAVLFVLCPFLLADCATQLRLGWVVILSVRAQQIFVHLAHYFCQSVLYFVLLWVFDFCSELLELLRNVQNLFALLVF